MITQFFPKYSTGLRRKLENPRGVKLTLVGIYRVNNNSNDNKLNCLGIMFKNMHWIHLDCWIFFENSDHITESKLNYSFSLNQIVFQKPIVCSGCIVVTTLDYVPEGPWFKSEWVSIYNKNRSTARRLPEPSLLWEYIGTRAVEHKGCNCGLQIDWRLQPRAVFGQAFRRII